MNISRALPLYGFLRICNNSDLEKKVLDCGAGGDHPPLSLFFEAGHETHGIELSEEALQAAEDFAQRENMDLHLEHGNMCALPYPDQSFSFLYSWNTTVHMDKAAVEKAVKEFQRVLVPGGLCYLNLLSYDCDTYGLGEEVNPGVFIVGSGEEAVQFNHYDQKEAENLLEGFEPIQYEHRIVKRFIGADVRKSGFHEYIVRKR